MGGHWFEVFRTDCSLLWGVDMRVEFKKRLEFVSQNLFSEPYNTMTYLGVALLLLSVSAPVWAANVPELGDPTPALLVLVEATDGLVNKSLVNTM